MGEARVKKVGAGKGKFGVIFRQKNLKSGGGYYDPPYVPSAKIGKKSGLALERQGIDLATPETKNRLRGRKNRLRGRKKIGVV
ncbi:hypothetical protein [Streptococcus pluranimalium]|uniref:hypothetical protein n=1 Tax=Streptococcus pluranimalium TaxID=82348 RepID=UPI003F66CF07